MAGGEGSFLRNEESTSLAGFYGMDVKLARLVIVVMAGGSWSRPSNEQNTSLVGLYG